MKHSIVGLARLRRFNTRLLTLALLCLVTSCGGGGSGDGSSAPGGGSGGAPASPSDSFTRSESAAFLTQATFGPTAAEIEALTGASASAWLLAQFAEPATYHLPYVLARLPNGDLSGPGGPGYVDGSESFAVASFWEAAIAGEDQLRQRVAYALSQIVVTSGGKSSVLEIEPHTQAAYMDALVRHAFGNYRDLLEDVTHSVAMARYLTYLGNLPGNADDGSVPDENYARELMQLFTIGLVELNRDGTPRLGSDGRPVETYTNADVSGLARVFTGLGMNGNSIFATTRPALAADAHYTPLHVFPEWHAEEEKSFLGTTIPPNTPAAPSIDQALDTLFNHPNVAPFIARQLIQRFVTSHPKPAYVERVASAFESGLYTLPNGGTVGDARRGDLRATLAAILFDRAARDPALRAAADFGKLREPAIRFTHWARAFKVNSADATEPWMLADTSGAEALNQHPFDAPSVFNFYRPGYVAPGTESGVAGLTAPEFQIVDSVSIVGYANFMSTFVFRQDEGANNGTPAFQPDYGAEIALAGEPAALVEHLDALLAGQRLSAASRSRIAGIVAGLPVEDATRDADLERRVQLAVLLVMTSAEYIVQR